MKTILTALGIVALSAGIAAAQPATQNDFHSKIGDMSLFGQVQGAVPLDGHETVDVSDAHGFTGDADAGRTTRRYNSKIGDRQLFGQVNGGAVEAPSDPVVRTDTYK